jgi:hypothetical protein
MPTALAISLLICVLNFGLLAAAHRTSIRKDCEGENGSETIMQSDKYILNCPFE